jgi:hypothetical protein
MSEWAGIDDTRLAIRAPTPLRCDCVATKKQSTMIDCFFCLSYHNQERSNL